MDDQPDDTIKPSVATTPSVDAMPTVPEDFVVDGFWGTWKPWGACTSTCGGGIKIRTRSCDNPAPAYGGLECPGPSMDTVSCAQWECPDCSRTCPDGGILVDCSYCSCDGVTLSGMVTDSYGRPLSGVMIYHENNRITPITQTDDSGYYVVRGICALGINFTFELEYYGEEVYEGEQANNTAVITDALLFRYIVPQFTLHPQDQARFVGQEVSFCCNARSVPQPYKYTWYRDDEELDDKSSNELLLQNLTTEDKGMYKCKAVSLAGSIFSQEANLIIQDATFPDTCNPEPEPYIEPLPKGCIYKDDNGDTNSSLNIGQCSKDGCITQDDDGVWPCNNKTEECCTPTTQKAVEIQCPGFTYTASIITKCGCEDCMEENEISTVEGRVSGIKSDGSIVYLKFGEIYFRDELIAYTSFRGKFAFNVPAEAPPLVVEFVDVHFNDFLPTIKTLIFEKGQSIYQGVLLPLKPDPITVQANESFTLTLGNDTDSVGEMEMPGLMTYSNGSTYNGSANVYTNFFDPRNVNDILSAPVTFQAVNNDGSVEDLKTYGFMSYSVEDSEGNPLQLTGNLTWKQDPEIFNVSIGKDGQPEAALWTIDYLTGKWKEAALFKFEDLPRRKLLRVFMVGGAPTPDISLLQTTATENRQRSRTVYDTITVRERRRSWWNVDWNIRNERVARTEYYVEEVTVTYPNLCYLRVRAYRNEDYQQGLQGATVTILTKQMTSETYTGYQQVGTTSTGFVCIRTHCGSRGVVFVEAFGEKLLAAQTHRIPAGYQVSNQNREDVQIELRDWGTVSGAHGPVNTYNRLSACRRATVNDYHIMFFPLSIPASLTKSRVSWGTFHPLNWYSQRPTSTTRKACFIKIKIQDRTYSTSMTATSRMWNATGSQYGTYATGPRSNPESAQQDNKAACIEYKCAGDIFDPTAATGVQEDVSTFVEVNFVNRNCSLTWINPLVNTINATSQGFTFTALPNSNYGSDYGIYTATGRQEEMKQNGLKFCRTGSDSGDVDDVMNPDSNVAVEFDCRP